MNQMGIQNEITNTKNFKQQQLILEKKIKRKPIEEWMRYQGRFRHLFKPEKDLKRIKTLEDHIY